MKNQLESLKSQSELLKTENLVLKDTLHSMSIPTVNAAFLLSTDFELPNHISHFVKVLLSRVENIPNFHSISSHKLLNDTSFVITNAISFDSPIVYASPGFLSLTGYKLFEVLGRNARFLQGAKTDRSEVSDDIPLFFVDFSNFFHHFRLKRCV
jgi:PAS domain-containing protein